MSGGDAVQMKAPNYSLQPTNSIIENEGEPIQIVAFSSDRTKFILSLEYDYLTKCAMNLLM